VRIAQNRAEVRAIVEANVWDERGEDRSEPRDEALTI
jgi:hypothetical protein